MVSELLGDFGNVAPRLTPLGLWGP